MGLDFGKISCARPVGPFDLQGLTVAIDVPNTFSGVAYQAMHTGATKQYAVAAARRVTIARVLQLAERGARSILVLDGTAHPLKRNTLTERDAQRRAKGIQHVEKHDYADVVQAASALGVPILTAPFDAEAQCARFTTEMSRTAHVVATTDWDALTMGAGVLLRGLSSAPEKWTLVHAHRVLKARRPAPPWVR